MSDDLKQQMAGMLANLEGEEMAGLGLDDLKQAMAEPHAAETIAELVPFEATSVQQGKPARDFTLPRLDDPSEHVTLSGHFGSRPVALIFGSYT